MRMSVYQSNVSMPSRAYASFLLRGEITTQIAKWMEVSMPSRAYASFLLYALRNGCIRLALCQCPLGLMHHFYAITTEADGSINIGVNALSGLCIISTRKVVSGLEWDEMCQCPLGLMHHFYGTPSKT